MSGTDGGTLPGPDLATEGAGLTDFSDTGMLTGHFDDQAVVLIKKGDAVYGVSGKCTHYSGPLGDGLFDGELLRCPWHHACFRPETGDAVHAPALFPITTFSVEQRGDRLFVTGTREAAPQLQPIQSQPDSVVIIGGGAAGFAAAQMLRREDYQGPVTMISADTDAPYDRPNCSKDFLAGHAEPDWMPLEYDSWYGESNIDLRLGRRVEQIRPAERLLSLDDGSTLGYGALLLATGATPIRLNTPGEDRPHVHFLRSMADSRAIIEAAQGARTAVVVGASFIGLEVAASLATRGLAVHVVAPEDTPMRNVLGQEFGSFVRKLHEQHGVSFHLGHTVSEVGDAAVTLDDRSNLNAQLVVFGVGVRPDVGLAEAAGLTVDRGVIVDEYLRTSDPAIWAAGDIARWPDANSGERIRVEHWVVAERQGQTAALNILGRNQPFDQVPFFWSQHYDVPINYVGSAQSWDAAEVSGSIEDMDCLVAYRKGGKILAVASIYRDIESLEAEVAIQRSDVQKLEQLVPRSPAGR
jgi:NADPH-dependent 2,4-dienoyl-CoA reductase/sulfur reductase-like enzyme/nitrite reductase/ring-hydroxylating ferredoxin subunit